MARLFKVTRPDSQQDELRTVFATQHRCAPQSERLKLHGAEAAGDDAVLFPVGVFGQGFPANVPFEVWATEPCGACGTLLRAWFSWRGVKVIDMGAK